MIHTEPIPKRPIFSWRRLLGMGSIALVAFWFASRGVEWGEVAHAIRQARLGVALLTLLVVIATQLCKAWRWQRLYYPNRPPYFAPAFWAIMVGQLVNFVSPVRIGELPRILSLDQSLPGVKARSLGTILAEKSVDIFMTGVTLGLALPFVVAPDYVHEGLPALALAIFAIIFVIYLLAFQTEWMMKIIGWGLQFLPASIAPRLEKMALSGLEGLSALKNPRQASFILLLSALIAFLGVLPSYLLFNAFGFSLGLVAAALMHAMLTIGLTPPSVPGRIFVFEAIVVTILAWLGVQDESVALSYAILFHLIVILPPIIFGAIALFYFSWRPRQLMPDQWISMPANEGDLK